MALGQIDTEEEVETVVAEIDDDGLLGIDVFQDGSSCPAH